MKDVGVTCDVSFPDWLRWWTFISARKVLLFNTASNLLLYLPQRQGSVGSLIYNRQKIPIFFAESAS